MLIRRYRAEDKDVVWSLHVEALQHAGTWIPSPVDQDLDAIEATYLESGGEFFVGETDGRIVAMGALRRVNVTTALVKRMRVLPAYQRRGYGQMILTALERRAVELGYRTLELDTTEQQTAAIALYCKNGYIQTGRRIFARFIEILFRKELV
jgi:ribosomal protein S18 acetylase RimI-like enzyme